jgi:hypothetical protein
MADQPKQPTTTDAPALIPDYEALVYGNHCGTTPLTRDNAKYVGRHRVWPGITTYARFLPVGNKVATFHRTCGGS